MSTEQTPGETPVPPPPARGTDFFGWIRGLGITRGSDRWMGGVASGLAHRWGVDPILVRGLFIVAAIFLGIGVLAYGLLWLLLPEPDGRIHVQEAAHGRWTGGMTGGLIVTILGLGGARAGFWFGERGVGGAFWGLFWVAVVAFGIYSVVRGSRRRSMAHTAPPAPAPSGPASGPAVHPDPAGTAYDGGIPAAGDPFYAKPTTPPSYAAPYGGYGAAHDAAPTAPLDQPPYYGGSLPPVPPQAYARPYTPRPPRPPRRPRASAPFVLVVLGVAALVAGALGVLVATGAVTIGASAVWTAVAIVVGVGILVAGLRGRGAGILTLFAIIALVAGAATQGIDRLNNLRATQSSFAPASISQARAGYDLTAEKSTLDLSALDNAGPLAAETAIPVKATMSDVTITVPKDIPVRVNSSSTLAEVTGQGQNSSGITKHDTLTYNTDKPGSALVLNLDATLSNVTINEER